MTYLEENIIIQLLGDREQTCRQVMDALKISQGTFKRIVDSLVIDGLVDTSVVVPNKILAYFLTKDGVTASTRILRYREMKGEVVLPRRVNIFEGEYVPTMPYQRNNGNKHIPSRGYI